MAWNQPGSSNNNPWGKKPAAGGDLDQAFKEWQKRIESLFGGGGGGGGSSTPVLIFIIIAVGAWMSTGFYQVKSGERGVVQRFGRHVETVGDGLGWRLPWPIETVTKVDVEGTRVDREHSRGYSPPSPQMVELKSRRAVPHQGPRGLPIPRARSEGHADRSRRERHSRSGGPQQPAGDPRATTAQRIVQDTREIMQRTLDQYGAGIEVVNVNITDVQVPEAVQAAQRDSVKAAADRERMVKEAQAYANNILPVAEGNAARCGAGRRGLQVADRVARHRRCLALLAARAGVREGARGHARAPVPRDAWKACSSPRARCSSIRRPATATCSTCRSTRSWSAIASPTPTRSPCGRR